MLHLLQQCRKRQQLLKKGSLGGRDNVNVMLYSENGGESFKRMK